MTIVDWAQTTNITGFITDDKTTQELYGHKQFVFSREKALEGINQTGHFSTDDPKCDEALEVLEERVESFLSRVK